MGKINVLDFEIANLIAAGEVVERPSSVLKELIENSIDSGATRIVAEIKRGGIAMISVTDNGCGIEKEDLPVALKRHATSKIKTKEDLDGIMTLGFRGEALAAISSVSHVTIITKTREAEIGTMLTSEGGKVTDISEVGTSDGTTVVVEDLFYNVPARRKFLKKDSTEAMNVAALVEKVALSRPDISIQLRIDGVEKFNTPGDGDLLNTVYAVFGKEFSEKLIACDGTANGIRVHGFIGRSDNVRKNRNLENIFINGRYVKSLTAMAALEKAYTSFIAPECFPACILFLEMNPSIVDVNVHPAKLEVKFANEQPVFEAVYYTVKRALEDSEYRPDMILGEKPKTERNPLAAFVPIGANTKGEQISMAPPPIIKRSEPQRTEYARDFSNKLDTPIRVSSGVGDAFTRSADKTSEMTPKRSLDILNAYATAAPKVELTTTATEKAKDTLPGVTDYKYIGEAFDCYIIVEYQGELLIIDKHAAHERVIFEELKQKRDNSNEILSKPLLLPITVMLTEDEVSAAGDNKDELLAVGFRFNLGEKNADIVEIPDEISAKEAEGLFLTMLDEIISGRGNPKITEKIRRDKMLYQVACKAAIKGGRVYDRAICEWLVSKVLALPDIVVCPHGRPIAYKLTKRELDRQFDRIK